jgi:hypothetical protein
MHVDDCLLSTVGMLGKAISYVLIACAASTLTAFFGACARHTHILTPSQRAFRTR